MSVLLLACSGVPTGSEEDIAAYAIQARNVDTARASALVSSVTQPALLARVGREANSPAVAQAATAKIVDDELLAHVVHNSDVQALALGRIKDQQILVKLALNSGPNWGLAQSDSANSRSKQASFYRSNFTILWLLCV